LEITTSAVLSAILTTTGHRVSGRGKPDQLRDRKTVLGGGLQISDHGFASWRGGSAASLFSGFEIARPIEIGNQPGLLRLPPQQVNRQRELLQVVSLLPNADTEFSPQDVVTASKDALINPFTQSQINQMLTTLAIAGSNVADLTINFTAH
jgi:hypothetical protein